MTSIVLTAAALLLAPAQAADIPACGVELHLRARTDVVEAAYQQLNTWSAFEIELVNTGDRPVTLVMPGDGSGNGRRTPVLRWSVSPDLEKVQVMYCGNINPLRPGEVFTLAPGERKRLREWVPPIFGAANRTYTVRLSYINDPALQWGGLELGPHDPATMQRVRESTPCQAVSNDVSITVVAKPPTR
jgi:hypothetical protein